MKTIYLDCSMGAAGDMLMAALFELCPDKEGFLKKMNRLGIPGVQVEAQPAVKCGITGTHMEVKVFGEEEESHDASDDGHGHAHEHSHDHAHHHHASMAGISHIISHLDLPDQVKRDMECVYGLIAEAESHAHGMPVDQIHFHEVGSMDAVADIAGVCLLLHDIGAEQIIASPVHVGSGHVHCAHGILPVPEIGRAHV